MKFNIIYYLASFLTAFLAFFFIAPTPVSAACNVGFCPDPASTFTHVYGYGGPLDWSELNCIHAELRDDTVPNYVSATSCTMSVVNGKLFIDLAFPAFFSNYSHNYRVTVTENAHSYDSVKFQFTQFDIHDKTSNGND